MILIYTINQNKKKSLEISLNYYLLRDLQFVIFTIPIPFPKNVYHSLKKNIRRKQSKFWRILNFQSSIVSKFILTGM